MRREEAMLLHGRGRRLRAGLAVAALAMTVVNVSEAVTLPQEFRDSFDTPGPLPGTLATDPWEIRNGVWTVTDADPTSGNPASAANRVLVQSSKAITPVEPLVFVRGQSFREVTAEVTIAFMDPLDRFGTLPQGASAGLVVRSPIDEGKADADNLYLFSAFSTGFQRGFPTGKALGLFKRVARGYSLLESRVVHTWADLTQPHRYKVVMGRGRISAYFDNRLVIEHLDLPSPDHSTPTDAFPGLPFDQGAVGLRTSATRAWFDDFVVIGNDAYEGRAFVTDAYTQFGESTQVRRGESLSVSQLTQTYGADRLDTSYVYGGQGIDETAVRALENPFNEDSEFGGTVRTRSVDGASISSVRLAGGELFLREPVNQSVTATLVAKGVEAVATADCEQTSSSVKFTEASLMVQIADDPVLPDFTVGPFPLATEYAPNTVIYERPGIIKIIAHPRTTLSAPQRVEAAALKIMIPEGGNIATEPSNIPVPGVTTVRVPGTGTPTPPLEITLAGVTAGRYCA